MNPDYRSFRSNLERKRQRVLFPAALFILTLLAVIDYFYIEGLQGEKYFTLLNLVRGGVWAIVLIEYLLVLKNSVPDLYLPALGVLLSILVALQITFRSVLEGGFGSLFYPGMFLVLIGVNLFLPWKASWVFWNGGTAVLLHIGLTAVFDPDYSAREAVNNFVFLSGTVFLSIFIAHHKEESLKAEFNERVRLEEKEKAIQLELLLASKIQNSLMPVTPYESEGLRLVAFRKSMGEVGGDFFDILSLPGGRTAIMLGDASGHGVPAALIAVMTKISLQQAVLRHETPEDILGDINTTLKNFIKTYDYLAAFLLILDEENRLTYSNAGCRSPLLMKGRDGKKVEICDVPGTILGIFPTEKLELRNDDKIVSPGDRIFLYTDGFIENSKSEEASFGEERVRLLLRESSPFSLEEAGYFIERRWKSFVGSSGPTDDAMFILLEIQ